jgi:RNA polymerase subunit RPABC4/transcription elongation factor Spt4
MSNLVECSDCGKEISKQAKACPHCGAPPPKTEVATEYQFMIWVIIITIASVFYLYFDDSDPSGESHASTTETMGGEFSSMKDCLSTFEENVGPLKILKDTPEQILGRTAAGKLFSCKRKDTGSRGTYYSGWYIVDK